MQSLCFSFQQALGRGRPGPPSQRPPAMAGPSHSRQRAGRGSQGGTRNGVQNHGSRHAVSTVGTIEGAKVDTTPTCPGHKGGMVPTWGEEVGQLQLQKLGGGAARQEAGIDWFPVDALSSAPSTGPGLIGLFVYINFFFFFYFLTFSLEKRCVRAPGWHLPPLMPAQRRGMALRGAEAPGAHLPRDGEGGRKGEGPYWAHQPTGQTFHLHRGKGVAQPPLGLPPSPSRYGALRAGRAWRSSKRQIRKHHPRGPGEPEPGLGESDVGRGLLFQVPKTEVTTPAPCGGVGTGS